MKTSLYYPTWCLLLTLALLAGCTQKDKKGQDPIQNLPPEQGNTLSAKYNPYLLLMADEERAHFFKLRSDLQRDRFLVSEGIKRKKYLEDYLNTGMTPEEVREILGSPKITDELKSLKGRETHWIYEEFNGYRDMSYALIFKGDKLTSWRLWLN